MPLVTTTIHSLNAPTDAAPSQSGRVRLAFLDGLRGLSAFYVMLYHLGAPAGLPLGLSLAWEWTHFGRSAVGVFIVLSGYSLMLPVARSADGHLRGGFWVVFQEALPPLLIGFSVKGH